MHKNVKQNLLLQQVQCEKTMLSFKQVVLDVFNVLLFLFLDPYVTQIVHRWKCSVTKTRCLRNVQIGMEVSTDFTNSFIETEMDVINI